MQIHELDYAELRTVYHQEPGLEDYSPLAKWQLCFNATKNKPATIVSKFYQLIQHRDVAQQVISAVAELGAEYTVDINQHKHRMAIDLKFPALQIEMPALGESFIVGFRVINSYDKSTGVGIVAKFTRKACTNGMVMNGMIPANLLFRHNSKEKITGLDIQSAINALINSNEKLQALISEAMKDTLVWKQAEEFLKKLVWNREKHFEEIKKILFVEYGATDESVTRWQMYNALTHYASHVVKKKQIEWQFEKVSEKLLLEKFV